MMMPSFSVLATSLARQSLKAKARRRFYPSRHLRKFTASTNAGGFTIKSNTKTARQPNFGIVAALTKKDGIIGINGTLPWTVPIPQDRDHFVNLTRDKILIVGRKTFAEEDPTGAHVGHVRLCIVVSNTMNASDLADREANYDGQGPEVKVARSFDDALDLASYYYELQHADAEKMQSGNATIIKNDAEGTNKSNAIDCWVGGGEGIYREALQHGNAREIHLTYVDLPADHLVKPDATTKRVHVAHFPLDCMDRDVFQESSRVQSGVCTFCLYEK